MEPAKSTRDEDVVAAVQQWLQEESELEQFGEKPMPPNYRKTALMSIASEAVKEDLKREERRILTEGLLTDDDHICEKAI